MWLSTGRFSQLCSSVFLHSFPGSNLGSHIAFSCIFFSLVSISLEHFFGFCLSSQWFFFSWRLQDSYVVYPSLCVFSCFLIFRFDYEFLAGILQKNGFFLRASHEMHMILFYLTIGDINFGHLVKLMYSRCFYCKDTCFFFVINILFVGRHCEMWEFLVFHKAFHMSFSFHWWFLPDSMMAYHDNCKYWFFLLCHSFYLLLGITL